MRDELGTEQSLRSAQHQEEEVMDTEASSVDLPWPCEFTCMGCGRKARGEFANHRWFKPPSWFERSDADGPQTVCSRECIDRVAKKTGKSGVVIPI